MDTNCSNDWRSAKLDQMIQTAIQGLPDRKKKNEIKGGDGMIPCCVGNQWYYRQKDCPDSIDQVIKREIISQNEEGYLLAGWNYAGRNPV